ncbi:hypothetical protein Catovirus_1_168 [Catovirus CTV1]|uniref:Uncharacterized protein n=1 Tax=Catovirus CTV1 TaxID=1977631 RepID=A0A1V0S902_9VIRU|nr:hypothetical protein Catovirus_1_168 [Catovirus CTV1]
MKSNKVEYYRKNQIYYSKLEILLLIKSFKNLCVRIFN